MQEHATEHSLDKTKRLTRNTNCRKSSKTRNKLVIHIKQKEITQRGIQFEKWITKLYDDLGKINVQHNITIIHQYQGKKAKSQFDIVYGLIIKKYIECKYHHENTAKVNYQEVSAFAGKLYMIGENYRKGIIITNREFEERAQLYAKKIGIQLINREQLIALDWKRSMHPWWIINKASKKFSYNLEKRILETKY